MILLVRGDVWRDTITWIYNMHYTWIKKGLVHGKWRKKWDNLDLKKDGRNQIVKDHHILRTPQRTL